jgi:hypothetical protein
MMSDDPAAAAVPPSTGQRITGILDQVAPNILERFVNMVNSSKKADADSAVDYRNFATACRAGLASIDLLDRMVARRQPAGPPVAAVDHELEQDVDRRLAAYEQRHPDDRDPDSDPPPASP